VKIDIRWQLLLVVICLGLVVSLLSYQVQSAGECTTRIPSTGGRLGVGIVGRPDKINPLLLSNNPVDDELANLIYDGLVRYDEEGLPAPSLAESWSVSEDGKTVHIELKDEVRWHDGQPFSAEDVVFTYSLLQEEDFPAPDALKDLWSSVVISSTSDYTIDLLLPQPYGPILDALTLGILPSHILADVPVDQLADHPFNSAPIGTGPLAASRIYNWEQTGNLRLVPNPEYWSRAVQIDTLDYYFYPDYEALGEAFSTGKIQAVTGITPDALPDILTLPGIRVFTSPGNIVTQLLFNLDADSSPLMQSESGRKALAQATDRAHLIDEANQGQGLIFDGPYIPESWASFAESTPQILFDPAGASLRLDELGWVNVEGSSTREKEGIPLTLRLLAIDNDYSRDLAFELTNQWERIGVKSDSVFVPFEEMSTNLSARGYDVAIVQVKPNVDPDLYDFWSQEAIVEGQNFGIWNSRLASESLESGRQAYSIEERLPYYESFVQTYNEDLPAFALFQHVDSFGLSDAIEDAEIGRYREPRDRYSSMAEWFMLYREVAVACPDDEVGES